MTSFISKYLLRKKVIFVLVLILFGSIATVVYHYKSTGVMKIINRELPIYSVETKEKKISISFDVAIGGVDNTMEILDILDKENVKATFFLIGQYIDQQPEVVKEIKKRGHEIGNHSNKHPDMTKVTKERIIEEISICDAKVTALIGEGTKLFRFPSGAYNELAVKTVQSTNHFPIQWDVDSIDWMEDGAKIEYDRVIKKTNNGSILLFHNNAKYTPENLPKIIGKLKGDGYAFVKVSELIYKENYHINSYGRQIQK